MTITTLTTENKPTDLIMNDIRVVLMDVDTMVGESIFKNADGSYAATLSETITSTEETAVTSIVLAEQKDSVKKIEQVFTFDVRVEGKRKDIVPKQILFEENRTLTLASEESTEKFHSYGKREPTLAVPAPEPAHQFLAVASMGSPVTAFSASVMIF